MSRGSDDMYDHGLNKLKLYQLGYYLELDEVEYFEDNDQYLKASITLFNEIIGDTKYFLTKPSPEIFEDKKERYSDKIKELEEKRKKGEEKAEEKFRSTEFFEELDLSKEERTLVLLLLAKRGVGISPKDPSLKGETIIHALKLTHDIPLERSRKMLNKVSDLRDSNVINRKKSPRTRPGSRKAENTPIESIPFYLAPRPSKAILGNGDMEIEETDEPKRRSGKNEKIKEDLMESIDPDVSFSDVILPEELKDSILSLLAQESSKDKFLEEWNMKSVVGERKGINLLFSGSPGTGKTMMAKAIGNRLEKEVQKVSLSDMVNLWYGETEKNVGRMFELVEEKEGVILLDEAEGLLNMRSGARSSTDATENRMVNLILQELEEHSGIIIMTSNLAKSIDPALERRMDLKVKFPVPDVEARGKIWEYHLPDELPLAEDVDIETLARKYDFPGGKIRNAVVNAARRSLMGEEKVVSQENLETACEKELEGEKAMDYYVGEKKSDDRGDDSRRYA